MKRLFLFVTAALLSLATFAQSDKFTQAMEKNLLLLDSAKTGDNYRSTADAFERIGEAEKTQWLPYYYAALSLSIDGWRDAKVDKDANAARIKALCDKASAINDNAEIYAIRNMAATQQMLVDPQSRWQSYGQEAGEALKKGLQMDPQNPRLTYLQGAALFGTPEQFGGGKAKAKPVLEKAVQLFDAASPKPLYPHWGKMQATEMLEKCN